MHVTLNNSSYQADSEQLSAGFCASEAANLAFLRRSLSSIKEEMALGTPIDPAVVNYLETRLAAFEDVDCPADRG